MAPLPETSTERVKYIYSNSVNQHSVIFRVVSGTPTADIDTIMQSLLSNLGINCMQSVVLGCERAPLGSSIFNPVGDSALVGDSFGSGLGNPVQDAESISFTGRGSDGRRARIFLFGYGSNDTNFRITSAESPGVAAFVTTINTVSAPLLTIGGTAPIFHEYGNINFNDHWIKQARA